MYFSILIIETFFFMFPFFNVPFYYVYQNLQCLRQRDRMRRMSEDKGDHHRIIFKLQSINLDKGKLKRKKYHRLLLSVNKPYERKKISTGNGSRGDDGRDD